MHGFRQLLGLSLTLQTRSFVYPATVVSTAVICGVVMMLPGRPLSPRLTAFFVFMDPATVGLSLVGAMVLSEKAQGTSALAVTPVRPAAYVASRALSLTLLTLGSGLVVALVARGSALDPLRQLVALALCSAAAVLIGLFCVARAASMNQLVMMLLWVTTLLYLPLLGHFDVLPEALTAVIAPIPSHAMLCALLAAADPGAVSPSAQTMSALYLMTWIGLGWRWTLREFAQVVLRDDR